MLLPWALATAPLRSQARLLDRGGQARLMQHPLPAAFGLAHVFAFRISWAATCVGIPGGGSAGAVPERDAASAPLLGAEAAREEARPVRSALLAGVCSASGCRHCWNCGCMGHLGSLLVSGRSWLSPSVFHSSPRERWQSPCPCPGPNLLRSRDIASPLRKLLG